jgi:hypothetical protein
LYIWIQFYYQCRVVFYENLNKLIMKYFIFLLLLITSCVKKQENIEQKIIYKQVVNKNVITKSAKNKVVEIIENDTSFIKLKKLDFNLFDIRFNNVGKRELVVVKNNSVKHKIKLLTGEDFMGFSVNWIKDIGNGFEVSIEFGKNYISRNFQFTYQNNSFFLTKIETHLIDYKNNNSKKEEVEIIVIPINIDDFRLEDFIK